jgi:ubiquinone/menaquinone biosynthesis C-methylase UbiE
MPANVRTSRWPQIVAWAVACLFVLGFFLHSIGAWTGPIMGVWLVGTQKPRRGFLWLVALSFIPSLIFGWRKFPLTGAAQALGYLGMTLLAAVLAALPLSFHRLTSPRLPGFASTLPFPLAAVAFDILIKPVFHLASGADTGLPLFLICWCAATIVWMWKREERAGKIVPTAIIFVSLYILVAGAGHVLQLAGAVGTGNLFAGRTVGWICLGGAAALTLWAVLYQGKPARKWADRPETVGLLRSPFTQSALSLATNGRSEALVSSSGERFPIRNGIPAFLKPEDLTGDNGKYNKLYEIVGGFYDDIQRAVGAFRGLELDSYFENYMSLLDVKPGDSVLETSVGTGLNFKYLPHGTKLSGLDLSPEMLTNCQRNLRRWRMDADLYLGNAESLPFADASFDVVFTCGGFNFFSDRAKAIREMIRVVKPGGQLMIEDETEEYVKSTYEKSPVTRGFYSNRKEAVTVPIDLVPPEMEDIHLEMLKDGKFYAITFRKPAAA